MTSAKNQPYKRSDRIADLLRKITSDVMTQKIHHWGVDGLTITRVEVSHDLKQANAFYRLLDPSQKGKVKSNLGKILPLVQKEIGRQMRTKYTPHLHFQYDEGLDHSDRIFDLLDQANIDHSEE
ncbi:MAG: 30S ribosome-binding factor RbfA [Deltaproteobacteria bacterium]|nr:30S ribosome-binding factor RbfA [Deltaproteobacteria bacterium]